MNILKKYYSVVIPFLAFLIYLVTLAPGVIQIDSGELAAVQATLGIAHPTGYPLFTITGYLFSLLPLPFSTIYQLNILAAIWCAAGIYFFILTAKILLTNINQFNTIKIKAEKKSSKKIKKQKETISKIDDNIPQVKIITGIITGALILAFSKTFWFQSTSVEVYSLHIFLIVLIIFTLIKAYLEKDNDLKAWLIFSAALALGFTNHMTTLLILPGAAYLFFTKHKFNKAAFQKIAIMLLIFFPLLILIYSYLPIRAAQDPVINWGNPIDFEKIIRHISGKQYQVWLFSSTEAAKKQLIYFFNTIFSEFNISLFICLAGMISSYIMARKVFVFLLITFASTVLYSINYDIADIDSYFLLAYISLAMFSIFGTIKLLSLLKFKASSPSPKNFTYVISTALIGLFVAVQFYINFSKADNSNTYVFEDYTKALINSTTKNSLIISYQWDYFISASYYFQFVEGFRKDAAIVDKELLRRSWYFKQLETAYPDLLAGVQTEKQLFLNALQPFEQDENYNSNLLENLYQRLMTNLISTNINQREVYIAPELFENEMQQGSFKLPEGFTIIPDLFLFKVIKGNEYEPAADPDFILRFPEKRNYYINMIENFTGSMLIRRAMYELQFDKVERAKMFIQKVKDDFPGYKIPPGLESVLAK